MRNDIESRFSIPRGKCRGGLPSPRCVTPWWQPAVRYAGLILPDENKAVGQVWNSRRWVGRVIDLITQAMEKGEGVWITVE